MKFCLIRALPFIALLLSFCSLLAARETKKSSAVTLKVTDVSGAVVPNVQIKFVSLESAEAKTLATDDAGKVLLELEPGSYDMIVTSPGFRTLKRRINVNAGESQKFELVLQIGGCPPGPCLEVTSPQSIVEQSHSDTKDIDISSVKLFAWHGVSNERKYGEVKEFRETKDLHIMPGPNFDLVCEVNGELGLPTVDFFLWTSVDFLIAPSTQEYENMDDAQIGSSVAWGQVTEMQDLKAVPIYFLRAGETRRVAVKNFDLGKVLTAFPVGNAGNLWPWVLRINIHVQDRNGKQITYSQRTVRLWPNSFRIPN